MPNMSCYQPDLMTYDKAFNLILNSVETTQLVETVELSSSLNRILAEDIQSTRDFPSWNTSAMDGYCFKVSSSQEPTISSLKIVGNSYAGKPYEGEVSNSECVRIMTGAYLPKDCNTVIMQEDVRIEGEKISLNHIPSKWQNVRRVASEVSKGDLLITKGCKINPPDIAVMASLGYVKVRAFKKLRIAIFSTGDELIQPGKELAFGQIYDSNRFAILSACKRMNLDTLDYGQIADDQDSIEEFLREAAANSDVIITTGGVSVGDADYVKPAIEKLGRIDLWKVAIKPGKPIAIGNIGNCKIFGLPGNPVSSLVTFNILVQPALEIMSGTKPTQNITIKAKLLETLQKKSGRMDFQRGIATIDEQGNWRVASTGSQGSANFLSLSQANCYIILDQYSTDFLEGDTVRIQFFNNVFS